MMQVTISVDLVAAKLVTTGAQVVSTRSETMLRCWPRITEEEAAPTKEENEAAEKFFTQENQW
jgi:hypothetical protein